MILINPLVVYWQVLHGFFTSKGLYSGMIIIKKKDSPIATYVINFAKLFPDKSLSTHHDYVFQN